MAAVPVTPAFRAAGSPVQGLPHAAAAGLPAAAVTAEAALPGGYLRLAPPPEAAPAAWPRVRAGRRGRRRLLAVLSFVLLVLLPLAATGWYMARVAAAQFHSEVAFSVRAEEMGVLAPGLLGAITQISGTTAPEAEMLRDYVESPQLVALVDARLDLRAIYARAPGDPVFALAPGATIEDLTDHWNRMVHVRYESQSGILHLRANAFTPQDAQAIAMAILDESGRLVNRLADQARQDAVRFATADLAEAEAHLRQLRGALAAFRAETRMIDPAQDVAGQMGLLGALQSELAEALVDRDTLLSYAEAGDQRAVQSARRIEAIRTRIAAERAQLGLGTDPGVAAGDAAATVGRYEALVTDIEFAQAAYTQALGNLALARAEARRTARYVAAHIAPTLAQSSIYPQRGLITGLAALAFLLLWGVVMVVCYNLRDAR
jgi:capsular polysaccharide transport system permease protein